MVKLEQDLQDIIQSLNRDEWNTIYRRHGDTMQKANDALMRADFTPIRQVYFDLTLLKDTRMGLLLALAGPTRYHYLEAGLTRYNMRLQRKFKLAYPTFPYTEEQLQRWWGEQKYSYDIFNHSPDTTLSYSLLRLIRAYLANNDRCKYDGVLTIVINVYPLKLVPLLQQYVKLLQTQVPDRAIEIRLISDDVRQWSAKTWLRYDALFVDDIAALMYCPGFIGALSDSAVWTNATIIAPPVVDDKTLNTWTQQEINLEDPKVIHDLMGVTEVFLQAYCNFHFVRVDIPLPPNPSVS